MKLTAKELELCSDIETRLTRRKRGAWFLLIGLAILFALSESFDLFSVFRDSPILSVGLGAAAAHLAYVYFAVRPEDKLIDLLQRYVNQDPEAIEQISKATEGDNPATEDHSTSAL